MFELLVIFTLFAGKHTFKVESFYFTTPALCEAAQEYAQDRLDESEKFEGKVLKCELVKEHPEPT